MAALEVAKDMRDRVGRWGVNRSSQSDDYVVSHKKTIHGLQKLVLKELSGVTDRYDEVEFLEGYLAYLQKKGASLSEAKDAVERLVLPKLTPPWFGLSQGWPLKSDSLSSTSESGSESSDDATEVPPDEAAKVPLASGGRDM